MRRRELAAGARKRDSRRWVVIVAAGIGGITGVAFFPSGLLVLWGIAIGLWLVFAAQRRLEPTVASAAA